MLFQLVLLSWYETQGLCASLDVPDFRQAKGTADGSFGPSNGANVALEKPEGILDSHRGSLLSLRETVLTFALVLKNPHDWISFSTSALQLLDQKKRKKKDKNLSYFLHKLNSCMFHAFTFVQH